MSLYIDSSALLKRYIDEADSPVCEELMASDPVVVTGRHTVVEVRRNLARLLAGAPLAAARADFAEDLSAFAIVELDAVTCELAATIGETTGVRTLDALHLAAAHRIGPGSTCLLTFDVRQAQAARSLGLTVLGS